MQSQLARPDGDSSSDSGSSDVEAPLALQWIVFPGGKMIHATGEDIYKPLCTAKKAPLNSSFGNGAWAALGMGHPLCPRCAGELPRSVVKLFMN